MHDTHTHIERLMSMWEYDMARSIKDYKREQDQSHIRKAIDEFYNSEMTLEELRNIILYYSA